MKYTNGRYYVEVKEKRYLFHSNENIKLKLREPPKTVRTEYRVQRQTANRKNQKVIKNNNNSLIVKKYPKKRKTFLEKPKTSLPICPNCKRDIWLESTHGYFCRTPESQYIINKRKHQID